MLRKSTLVASFASVVLGLTAVGCKVETPLTPAPPPPASAAANADGSTLKVSAPSLVSPVGDTVTPDARPTMVISAAAGQFASAALAYEFQLMNDAGALVLSSTQAGTSFSVPSDLNFDTAFRWRARATAGGGVGPWSPTGRFFTSKAPLPRVTVSSNYDEFKAYFFALIAYKGVGPIASVAALQAMEADMLTVGILLEKTSGGEVRGRIYLPTGNPSNLYTRAVDIGDFGKAWAWVVRGSGTVCEGICK